jgi:23S rRNA pseudouridine2605 synthase
MPARASDAANASPQSAPGGGRSRPAILTEPSEKLHKVLAQAGLGSRRLMEEWIGGGRVSVNGKVAGIGTRVAAADRIQVDGRDVRRSAARAAQLPRVLIYHKPEGEIVTRDDPQGRETVFERLPRLRGARWLSVGRLDVSTGGLLLFTTGGALANHLMHPRYAMEREYAVRVFGRLDEARMKSLREGVILDDGEARCASLEEEGPTEGGGANHWYRIVMTEGRNRVVRRLFEAVGFTVSRLMRVRFGPVHLPPRLKRGQFVEMPPEDVRRLVAQLEAPARPVTRAGAGAKADARRPPRRPAVARASE